MAVLLSFFAILISVLAIQMDQWVSFVPQLGIEFQYYRRRNRVVVSGIALGLALVALLLQPNFTQAIVVAIVIGLIPLSGFMHAAKALVAVDTPKHVSASAAVWASNSKVLGYVDDDGQACAWQLDTLIPHHLINDCVAGKPILVAW